MAAKRLTERFAFAGTVGEGAKGNTIEAVPLCGAVSANRRRYRPEAFAGDRVNRYNGRPVFLNHGSGRDSRSYQDQIGTIENARLNAAGLPIGDIVLNPKKPFAEAVLWDAKNKPQACGMSHVAQCETVRGKDGWEEITEIVSVESVDLVTDPATTSGLRAESRGKAVPKTVKELAEWVAKHPKSTIKECQRIKRLAEMDGTEGIPMPDVPEETTPGDAITEAFKSAFDAIRDQLFDGELDKKAAFKKLSSIFDGHSDVKDDGKSAAGDDDADPDKDTPATESKRKRPDPSAVLKECSDAGYTAPPEELTLLFEQTDPAKRQLFIRAQMKKQAESKTEKPRASGRNPGGATKVSESKQPTEPAKDSKDFLTRIFG